MVISGLIPISFMDIILLPARSGNNTQPLVPNYILCQYPISKKPVNLYISKETGGWITHRIEKTLLYYIHWAYSFTGNFLAEITVNYFFYPRITSGPHYYLVIILFLCNITDDFNGIPFHKNRFNI